LLLHETRYDQVEDEEESSSVQENLRKGLETIRKVPLFRYLAVVVMLTRITFTVFIFHNLLRLSQAPGTFESLLSLFGIVSALLPLVLQWQVVPRLTGKIETRDAFIILPATLALGMLACTLLPNSLWPVVIGLLLGGSVSSSWDYPMQNTLQNLIPEEHRPQVSALLSNYSFAIGQVSGAVALLVIFALTRWLGISPAWFYLPLGLLAALGALWAAVMVRQTYTESMLSWRMARRTRAASILDKLE
jgi:MFS family permease